MPRHLLTILVPTLECRDRYFERLHAAFSAQPDFDREVIMLKLRDRGQETTGMKRHRLIHAAKTPYVVMFDDDDLPAPSYCRRVLKAIKQEPAPDVIGFRLKQFDDGEYVANAIHSVKVNHWHTGQQPGEKPIHYRTPNHLNPIKREMAIAVGYCDRNYGEDADYSERLALRFPNMREVFIDEDLYLYMRRKNRSGERRNPNP